MDTIEQSIAALIVCLKFGNDVNKLFYLFI